MSRVPLDAKKIDRFEDFLVEYRVFACFLWLLPKKLHTYFKSFLCFKDIEGRYFNFSKL